MYGQEDAEGGTLPWPRVHGDPALGLLDDAIDRRQAEARPLSHRLGCEEGVEDLCHDLGRNPGSVVGNLDQGLFRPGIGIAEGLGLGRRDPGGPDSYGRTAVGPDGVTGIDDEVHHRGLELAPVRPHGGQAATILGHQGDILRQDPPQQNLELGNEFAKIEAFTLDRLLAGKGQKFANEFCSACRGLPDLVEALIGGIAHRMALRQLVKLHEDGHQKIIEVVGHTARELADGLHLLALGQLEFDLLLF